MRLDLRDLLDTPGRAAEVTLDSQIEEFEDLALTSPVQGFVKATNSRQAIVVQGHVQATVRLECSRCLCNFERSLAAEVEAICPMDYFQSLIADVDPEEEPDEETLALFDAISLDVEELVRQCLLVELPIQPLCRRECKGLCPSCGTDLNTDRCGCNEPSDPRWNQLATLLHEQKLSWN